MKYLQKFKEPVSDLTDRKQNLINFQESKIESLLKENRVLKTRLVQFEKTIKDINEKFYNHLKVEMKM
jgi:hypothetical protein